MKSILLGILLLTCMGPVKPACGMHLFASKLKLSFGDKMWEAIHKSDLTKLNKIFEKTNPTPEQLNTTNPSLQTPLMWFAYTGKDLRMANIFIEKGANINFQDVIKKSNALMEAAMHGHEKIAKLLIANGAAINLQDYEGNTALMHAIEKGHTSLAEYFIQRDADLALANNDGQTPLILAARKDTEKIVQALLRKESVLDHADALGKTAFEHAKEGSTVQKLLQAAHAQRRTRIAQDLKQHISVADLANIVLSYL